MRIGDDVVDGFLNDMFAQESAAQIAAREKGMELRPGMAIHPHEGKILYLLASMIQAKQILEIGCFMGYSALWMARALPEDGRLVSLEYDEDYAELARSHIAKAGVQGRVEIKTGNALETLPTLSQEWDMVFIDADKVNYANYVKAVIPHVRSGGLIVADNALLFGAMLGEEHRRQKTSDAALASMQEMHETLCDELHFVTTMLPTGEGMTVALKK